MFFIIFLSQFSKAQHVVDSIPHIGIKNFTNSFLIKNNKAKVIYILDSMRNPLIRLNIKHNTLKIIDKTKVKKIHDTSFLISKGSIIKINLLTDSILINDYYIDYSKNQLIEFKVSSESMYTSGAFDANSSNFYNRNYYQAKLLQSSYPIEINYLGNTDNMLSNPLNGLSVKFDFESYRKLKKSKIVETQKKSISKLDKMKNPINDTSFLGKSILKFDTSFLSNRFQAKDYKLDKFDSSFQSIKSNKKHKLDSLLDGKKYFSEKVHNPFDSISLNNMNLNKNINIKSIIPDSIINKRYLLKDKINYNKELTAKKKYVFTLAKRENYIKSLSANDIKYSEISDKSLVDRLAKFKDWNTYKQNFKIKKLEFGRFAPRYSDLVLNNITLNGISSEFIISKFTFSALAGMSFYRKHDINLSNDIFDNNKQIFSAKVNYRLLSGMNIYLIYLKGEDIVGPPINRLNINEIATSRLKSDVVSTGFSYKLGANTQIIFDYAQSYNSVDKSLTSEIFNIKNSYSDAYQLSFLTKLKNYNTGIAITYRKTEPLYLSPGVQYLRNDYEYIEGRATQPLFHNNVVLSSSVKFGRDNLYDLKIGASENVTVNNKLLWKMKRKFTLTLLSNTTKVLMDAEIKSIFKSNFYNATLVKQYKGKDIIHTFLINTGLLENTNQQSQYYQNNANLSATQNFLKKSLMISNTFTFSRNTISDTAYFFSHEMQLNKNINSYLSGNLGIGISDIAGCEIRKRVFVSLTISNKYFNLTPYAEYINSRVNEKILNNFLFKLSFNIHLKY